MAIFHFEANETFEGGERFPESDNGINCTVILEDQGQTSKELCEQTGNGLLCAAETIRLYGRPTVSILGTIFNVIAIVVFSRPQLRRTPTCIFLIAVAIGDLLTVLNGFLPWIQQDLGADLLTSSSFVCKFSVFILYWGPEFSALLVTTMTAERYMKLRFPTTNAVFCTVKHSAMVIVVIGSMLFILNLEILASDIYFNVCGMKVCWNVFDDSERMLTLTNRTATLRYWRVHRWIALSLYWIIPVILLPLLNILIAFELKKQTRYFINDGTRLTSSIATPLVTSREIILSTNRGISYMLLTVTLAFIFLTSGFNLIQSDILDVFKGKDLDSRARSSMLFSVFILLFYVNHASNFFFYCLSVRTYRTVVYRMISRVLCGRLSSKCNARRRLDQIPNDETCTQ